MKVRHIIKFILNSAILAIFTDCKPIKLAHNALQNRTAFHFYDRIGRLFPPLPFTVSLCVFYPFSIAVVISFFFHSPNIYVYFTDKIITMLMILGGTYLELA